MREVRQEFAWARDACFRLVSVVRDREHNGGRQAKMLFGVKEIA